MAANPPEPGATADLGSPGAGSARKLLLDEMLAEREPVPLPPARVVDELDRMRGTLFDHDSLLDEYSQRLHEEQEAQAKARADLVRAEEAQRVAERNLEIATETARRRPEDDHARLVKVEEELRD